MQKLLQNSKILKTLDILNLMLNTSDAVLLNGFG